MLNVVRSSMYVNLAVAAPNGCFGRDVSKENNPNFGKRASGHTRELISRAHTGRRLSNLQIDQRRVTTTTWWKEHPDKRAQKRVDMSGTNNPQFSKLGIDHPHFGIAQTVETRKKIKEALLGKRKQVNMLSI